MTTDDKILENDIQYMLRGCDPHDAEARRHIARCIIAYVREHDGRDAWQPIETAPRMRKIIVHYLNKLGRHRVVMACFYEEKALEMHDDYEEVGVWDEASETCFAPAGWYEEHDSDDPILTLGGEPTHWMPLPAPPVIDAAIARNGV